MAVIPEGKLQLPLLLHALLVVIPAGNLLLLLLLPLPLLLFVFRRHSERSEEPPHSPVLAVALP